MPVSCTSRVRRTASVGSFWKTSISRPVTNSNVVISSLWRSTFQRGASAGRWSVAFSGWVVPGRVVGAAGAAGAGAGGIAPNVRGRLSSSPDLGAEPCGLVLDPGEALLVPRPREDRVEGTARLLGPPGGEPRAARLEHALRLERPQARHPLPALGGRGPAALLRAHAGEEPVAVGLQRSGLDRPREGTLGLRDVAGRGEPPSEVLPRRRRA